MKLSPNDFAVIEQALREGINHGYDYRSVMAYREVLSKLQAMTTEAADWYMEAGEEPSVLPPSMLEGQHAHDHRETINSNPHARDGFRYDYDDIDDLL